MCLLCRGVSTGAPAVAGENIGSVRTDCCIDVVIRVAAKRYTLRWALRTTRFARCAAGRCWIQSDPLSHSSAGDQKQRPVTICKGKVLSLPIKRRCRYSWIAILLSHQRAALSSQRNCIQWRTQHPR
jgi:hypothetical protein